MAQLRSDGRFAEVSAGFELFYAAILIGVYYIFLRLGRIAGGCFIWRRCYMECFPAPGQSHAEKQAGVTSES